MKKLNYYIHIFCSSYTIASLLVALVNILSIGYCEIGIYWIFQMALLCGVITILMYITDVITDKFFKDVPVWIFVLTGLTEVLLCVFILGGLCFEWFPFNLFWIFAVIGIDIVIYFSVFGIMFMHEQRSADNINKILKNCRNKNKEDRRYNNGKDN